MDLVSQTLMMGAAGAGGGPDSSSWFATLGGAGSDYAQDVAVDSLGNIYVVGYGDSQGAGSFDAYIAKYNTSGAIQWQRSLGGAGSDYVFGISVDNSDNIYISGGCTIGNEDLLIAKYNTSGVIQWQRRLSGATNDRGYCNAIDSSGNVYVVGYSYIGSNYDIILAKYNSSGAILWQRRLGDTVNNYGRGVAVDGSGDVYIIGYTESFLNDIIVAKYNTSGVIQWQRSLYMNTNADVGSNIVVDGSSNVYIVGYTESQGAGLSDLLIAKYNTSGTIQWQRSLGGTNYEYGNDICVDSSGNIYVAGYTRSQGAGNDDVLIAKYNSSGTIQWQRSLGGAGSDYGIGISADNSNNIYVVGYTTSQGAGNNDMLIAKLPGDGSKTGTYGNFTYAARTLTDASRSLLSSASSLTDASTTLTDASTTLTDAARTLTSTTTTI